MKSCSFRNATRGAFTLVEVLIVIVIMAVLATVIVQQHDGSTQDAKIALVRQHLVVMKNQIELQKALSGSYPREIKAAWFASGIPKHPFNDGSVPDIHVFTTESTRGHPQYKLIDKYGAYWYNPDNGELRARVPDQGSNPRSLAAYNLVNNSNLTSMNDTN